MIRDAAVVPPDPEDETDQPEALTEDAIPEDVSTAAPRAASKTGTTPLKPEQWDRRWIALVSLAVYSIVLLAVLAKLLIWGPMPDGDVSVSMIVSTAAASFSTIVGFYFATASR